jgi:4-hydroxy-2-oxoheptanedioate aldolase
MTSANPLITQWRAGATTFGVWCTMPGSVTAEFIARQGPHYVCVDYQHGLIDHTTAVPMIQAIEAGGSIPIARVAWNQPHLIMQVLDAGVRGVVIPMINSAADATLAARAFRYPPDGDRSFGPVRARETLGGNDPALLADQACIIMIETAEGLANVAEIAAVPGVHALYIGPSDLALALGLTPGQAWDHPGFLAALSSVESACRANGLAIGIQCGDGQTAAGFAARGYHLITVGTDAPILTAAIRAHLTQATTSQHS